MLPRFSLGLPGVVYKAQEHITAAHKLICDY